MTLQEDHRSLILVGSIAIIGELLRAWNARRSASKGESMSTEVAKVQMGIKDTDEVVTLIILAAKGAIESAADGKFDASDLPKLMPALLAAGPAIEGIQNVPAELWDLDSEEGVKIVGRIAGELTLSNEHAKKILVAGLQAAVANYGLVKVILDKA